MSPTIATMIAAAREAGQGLMQDRARIASLTVQSKAGVADMFSEADLRAEATVRRALMAFAPDYGFLGEEGGLEPGADPHHVWMVDPLDGTTNFLTGSPLFAVNIGLVRDGEVIAGVTLVPALDELFWAEKGKGAWLGDQRRLRVAARRTLAESVLATGIPFAGRPGHTQFLKELHQIAPRVAGVRRYGSAALDMAYVAAGRFDGYWERGIKAWDVAAGSLLILEAGGTVSGADGEPFDPRAGHLCCANLDLQPLILERLKAAQG